MKRHHPPHVVFVVRPLRPARQPRWGEFGSAASILPIPPPHGRSPDPSMTFFAGVSLVGGCVR